MNPTTALWYAAAVLGALFLLQAFATPLSMFFRILGNSIAGGLGLWALNAVGGHFGFHLGLNPASAVIAGLLGVPGVLGLGLMRLILS